MKFLHRRVEVTRHLINLKLFAAQEISPCVDDSIFLRRSNSVTYVTYNSHNTVTILFAGITRPPASTTFFSKLCVALVV